jgi:hypothetical protein
MNIEEKNMKETEKAVNSLLKQGNLSATRLTDVVEVYKLINLMSSTLVSP